MMLFYFILHVLGQRWSKFFLSYSSIAHNKIATRAPAERRTMKSTVKECWNISY